MNYRLPINTIKEQIEAKLQHNFGLTLENATDDQCYKAVVLVVRDLMVKGYLEFKKRAEETHTKRVYYLCMEFLMGRSLKNNLYNLGIEEDFRKALSEMGLKLDNLYEKEPDAGLGNGGLGRLAACFLDGLSTQGYPAVSYTHLVQQIGQQADGLVLRAIGHVRALKLDGIPRLIGRQGVPRGIDDLAARSIHRDNGRAGRIRLLACIGAVQNLPIHQAQRINREDSYDDPHQRKTAQRCFRLHVFHLHTGIETGSFDSTVSNGQPPSRRLLQKGRI